jgi:homopolymeric O-antigen transport system permease protein
MLDGTARSGAAQTGIGSHARPRKDRGSWTFGRDFYEGVVAWRLWSSLGWSDIKQRYRRSVLGPFWITLSMAVLILVLGYIYSNIFHTDIKTYLPFLSLGFILWGFISTTITESGNAFRESARIIKQVKVPHSIHILRVLWRNFIVLLHTIVIFIPVSLVFALKPNAAILLALPGLALVCVNLAWLELVLAILSTRFRDVPLIVATLVQVTMFATPIMWPVEALGDRRFIADVNPMYHLIELVRAPLLGTTPAPLSWIVAAGMAVAGWIIALALFNRVCRSIVYWL